MALVGIVIGVPLGVVAGRAVWQVFATNLGVVPVTVIAVGTLAVLAAAVLVGAIVLAIGPALVSARSRPAALLRTEWADGGGLPQVRAAARRAGAAVPMRAEGRGGQPG